VTSPITLKGTVAPRAKVLVRVDYGTTVIGGIRLTGALYEEEVEANAAGVWETAPIDLKLMVNGDDTTYKVTVTLVVAEGVKAPDPTIITLKKK